MKPLASHIHAAARPGVLALTGGGSLALADLLSEPGASRTVLEALIPYARPALEHLLAGPVERACSPPAARNLAMAAFWRAWQWSQPADDNDEYYDQKSQDILARIWGVGCTASLRSERPKRGEHRCHVAIQRASATDTFSLVLEKGARTRAEEERLVADLVLQAVARAVGLETVSSLELRAGEQLTLEMVEAPADWADVMLGRVDAVALSGLDAVGVDGGERDGALGQDEHSSGAVLPGAFNPLHQGHRQMAALASEKLGVAVEYELSVENVDKPLLDYAEIRGRLAHFHTGETVWLTRAATFVEKARIFPGATFVVGVDTLVRIGAERYYGSLADRDAALQELARLECRFLVFPRRLGGEFATLETLDLPATLRALCSGVAVDEFREDISSTEIRAASSGDEPS